MVDWTHFAGLARPKKYRCAPIRINVSLHKEPIDFFSLSPAFILSEFVMNERVPLYL